VKCNIFESETECKEFGLCFWTEGNNPRCVKQVYEKIVKLNKTWFIIIFIKKKKNGKSLKGELVKKKGKKKKKNVNIIFCFCIHLF
jgi:hypothetical protein